MNINIVDPGLRELSGHHYDFVRKINNYLTSQGHTVAIYSHQNTNPDILSKFNNITPVFRSFPYPQFQGEILDYHHHSWMIQEDLHKIPDADYWIWPSTFSFQVNGFRMSERIIKSVGCIHVEHDFHHDVYGKEQWTHGLTDTFNLFAMEHKLVQSYNEIGVPCSYIPNPANNIPLETPKRHLKTIGFLGHQRSDKGLYTLIKLVELLKDTYQIILHDSAGCLKYDHPKVKCYSSVPEISTIIRECDLVILPYDRTKYRKMSSGILCEALSIGIPCLVPSDTSLADWIEKTQAGAIFYGEDIIKTVVYIDKNYDQLSSNSFKTAKNWLSEYGESRFMDALFANQNSIR